MGVKAWITVNGQHIPIMDGESKMAAVGRFIKGKRDASKRRMKEMDRELSGDLPHTTKDIYNKYNKEADRYKKLGGGKDIKERAKTAEEIQDERFELSNEKFPKVRKALARDLKNTFEVGKGKEKYIRLDGRKTTEEDIDKKARNIASKNALWDMDSKYGKYASNESKQANISYRKDYIGPSKYKLKANNYKLSKAESKLQDFAQTSKSEYNISNIKAKELPSGAIHITTKSGKDISTISPRALTTAEKNDLRRKGILK